jgi:glycine oxidase
VEAIETEAGSLRVVSGRYGGQEFAVECEVAVLAAGAWSSTAIKSPASGFGIRPVKGQIVRLQGPRLIRHVIRTPDVYLVGRDSGELVLGATMEEQGFHSTPTAGAIMDIVRRAWHLLPGIYDHTFQEVEIGFRPATRDNLPVIGATDVEGLFVAAGHYRHGILLAPATGDLLADLIADGQNSELLPPFSPRRL